MRQLARRKASTTNVDLVVIVQGWVQNGRKVRSSAKAFERLQMNLREEGMHDKVAVVA